MVEVWAAVAGASITVAGVGVSGLNRQTQNGRESLVRFTASVDNLSSRLDILHNDIKTKDMGMFARLNELSVQRARLEVYMTELDFLQMQQVHAVSDPSNLA